jgi:hypothetical protein
METKFSIRKSVSLTLGLSFGVMTFTGLILYIVPKGKIAYWSDWMLLGLSKEEWAALHITSMVLLIIAGVWHIYYNWTPLVNYLKDSAKKISLFKREFLAALALNLFFVIGTLYTVQPLKSVLDLNDAIKAYWERSYGAPPFGHAEESTLKAFSGTVGMRPEQALELLKAKGIKVRDNGQTLKKIARENGMSPQQLYTILKPGRASGGGSGAITYLGRRSLQELSEMRKIDLDRSLAFLKAQGVDAVPQMRMREAAEALGTTPYGLYEALQSESRR